MDIQSVGTWFVEHNESELTISSFAELKKIISQAEGVDSGRLWIGVDGGPRPWWHRLLGTQPRYVNSLFSLEWFGQYASLIFHDENWSEYRVIDKEYPVTPDEGTRLKIAQGEKQPNLIEECMNKERAFTAISEFIKTGAKPTWLTYHLVK